MLAQSALNYQISSFLLQHGTLPQRRILSRFSFPVLLLIDLSNPSFRILSPRKYLRSTLPCRRHPGHS